MKGGRDEWMDKLKDEYEDGWMKELNNNIDGWMDG